MKRIFTAITLAFLGSLAVLNSEGMNDTPQVAHGGHRFSKEEDSQLRDLVSQLGPQKWSRIAAEMPERNARSCRERWINYLAPSINQTPWTQEEDRLLLEKQRELGSKWTQISKFFDGRTDIHIKHRWLILSRKLRQFHTIIVPAFTRDAHRTQENPPRTETPEKFSEFEHLPNRENDEILPIFFRFW
jgi:hypothetical protein